jgi:hypothetical protein
MWHSLVKNSEDKMKPSSYDRPSDKLTKADATTAAEGCVGCLNLLVFIGFVCGLIFCVVRVARYAWEG